MPSEGWAHYFRQSNYFNQKINLKHIKKYRINNSINASEVRLIDANNENQGVVSFAEAISMAKQAGLDLVEISPKANPPVVRIMDFGQFKYELKKKEQKNKASQKKSEMKGIRLSFRIGDNDKMVRRKQAEKFLKAGNKVRVEMILKGREKAHQDLARQMIKDFVESIEIENKIEQDLKKQGSKLQILISPKN